MQIQLTNELKNHHPTIGWKFSQLGTFLTTENTQVKERHDFNPILSKVGNPTYEFDKSLHIMLIKKKLPSSALLDVDTYYTDVSNKYTLETIFHQAYIHLYIRLPLFPR